MAAPDQPGPEGPGPDPAPSTKDVADSGASGSAESESDDADRKALGPTGIAPDADDDPGEATVDFTELPDGLRARVADIAAAALGELPTVDVPQSLRQVARFAPAKRAQLGAAAILRALQERPSFRAALLRWCAEHRPDAIDQDANGAVAAGAAAVLLGDASAPHYVELVARRSADAGLRSERDAAQRKAARLAEELAEARAELREARGSGEQRTEELRAEADRLRKRLREQGVRLREARDEAAAGSSVSADAQREQEQRISALTAERDRESQRAATERARAQSAEADSATARQAAKEARAADEVRLALLIETLDGAVTGLRRELALGGSGPRPADTVRGATVGKGSVARVEDPAALDRLLALSAVHLIVDGYNVTKTGFAELSLADQRDRLTKQLGTLAARTGAETTLVFDGAGVVSVPPTTPRGVRVLFSDPGVLADDVIRALVAAEPEGRPVVVVTSDRAVADSVRRRGAHPVPSAVLLARLGRV